MFKIRSAFKAKSALEGPPFLTIIKEKSKSRLRKSYIAMFFLWIIDSLLQYRIKEPIQISSQVIFLLVFIPAFAILLDNQIIIIGDHDQWNLLRVKNFIGKQIIISDITCLRLRIEIRVVSSKRTSSSLIVLDNPTKKMSIKCQNNQVNDFITECEIINLKVDIRKRGSSNSKALQEIL